MVRVQGFEFTSVKSGNMITKDCIISSLKKIQSKSRGKSGYITSAHDEENAEIVHICNVEAPKAIWFGKFMKCKK